MTKSTSYLDSLAALRKAKPLIAESLVRADHLRTARLAGYLNGMRLAGLERLYEYLDAAYDSYMSHPDLASIAFLLRRVRSDYETALEATLSGYQGVASDAMRDVMEIEGLLLDFTTTSDNREEWLHADRKTLINKYGPGAVRKRLKAAGVAPYSNEGFEPVDYQAHSQALHVSPASPPFATRGIEGSETPGIFGDLGFVEMFEHGNRIMFAIELLRVVGLELEPTEYQPLLDRQDFDDAYERTEEMQVILIAVFSGPHVLRERLGREPKTSELLDFIADELEAKSPRSDAAKA